MTSKRRGQGRKSTNRRKHEAPYNPMSDSYWMGPYGDFPNRRKKKR